MVGRFFSGCLRNKSRTMSSFIEAVMRLGQIWTRTLLVTSGCSLTLYVWYSMGWWDLKWVGVFVLGYLSDLWRCEAARKAWPSWNVKNQLWKRCDFCRDLWRFEEVTLRRQKKYILRIPWHPEMRPLALWKNRISLLDFCTSVPRNHISMDSLQRSIIQKRLHRVWDYGRGLFEDDFLMTFQKSPRQNVMALRCFFSILRDDFLCVVRIS